MRKPSSVTPKNCAFCGAPAPLTGEHVFAEWLAPYLPKLGSSGHTVSNTLRAVDGANLKIHSDNYSSRKGDLYRKGRPMKNQTLKIVCERCNSGWMSLLQDQVPSDQPPEGLGNLISQYRARQNPSNHRIRRRF
jgi:hypothetical protein